jgi:plastocyanin
MLRILLLSGLAALGLSACGSDNTSASCTEASATQTTTVTLESMAFSPSCFKVAAGTTVTFRNSDNTTHTVTTDSGQVETFDSGNLVVNATYTHTFSTPGTINLHCTIHPSMQATAIVTP